MRSLERQGIKVKALFAGKSKEEQIAWWRSKKAHSQGRGVKREFEQALATEEVTKATGNEMRKRIWWMTKRNFVDEETKKNNDISGDQLETLWRAALADPMNKVKTIKGNDLLLGKFMGYIEDEVEAERYEQKVKKTRLIEDMDDMGALQEVLDREFKRAKVLLEINSSLNDMGSGALPENVSFDIDPSDKLARESDFKPESWSRFVAGLNRELRQRVEEEIAEEDRLVRRMQMRLPLERLPFVLLCSVAWCVGHANSPPFRPWNCSGVQAWVA